MAACKYVMCLVSKHKEDCKCAVSVISESKLKGTQDQITAQISILVIVLKNIGCTLQLPFQ